jgi:hypothetical protein
MRSIFLLIALISMAGCSQSNYAKYGPIYEQVVLSEVPDYSNLNYWAAHPNKKNPSDSIPKGILEDKAVPQKAVDVFFVYPTSYLDKTMPQGWNAQLNDAKLNIYTDFSSILYQASVFNEVGKIYAPRYRQANINAYYPVTKEDTLKAIDAFDLAYTDVKNAFEYYLKNNNNGRPIIIASHSQGSTHAIRLLKEYFDGKPLSKQLVAAYVVGMALNPATYTNLKACEKPNQTGCICAWRTFEKGYIAPFVEKENYNSIVTNPLSWSNENVEVERTANEGSLLYNFNKLIPKVAGAINHNGVLWTPKPKFLGNVLIRTQNYHIADYNLYYSSIRKNAATRVLQFLAPNELRKTNE